MPPPVTDGFSSAWIEKGTVIDVDMQAWTCTVRTEYDGKDIPDLQMASPYFHWHAGEGIFALPEVGAQALVCHPSDNDPSFILGFVGAPEEADRKQAQDAGVFIGDETVESSEGAIQNASYATYRGGRRKVTPGSIVLAGRDGNNVILHRGGVVEIGATPMCQRFYIPVMNTIRDVAENIHTSTPSGELYWSVERQETSGGTSASTSYRLAIRDKISDKKASVQLHMGHVDSSNRYELVVDPNVKPDAGTYSATPQYRIRISATGNVVEDISGSATITIKKGRTVDVTGSDKLTVTGARTVKVTGAETTTVKAARMVRVTGLSTHDVKGAYVLTAPRIAIGSKPKDSMVLGIALVKLLGEFINEAKLKNPKKLESLLKQLPKIVSKYIQVGP